MIKHARGAGLGFRREILAELKNQDISRIKFFEVAPENWSQIGGRYAMQLREFTERFAFVCHGLSLSIGSTDALDIGLLKDTKSFMSEHGIGLYTEHLSWCSKDGHLYDLLPIPCTREAVRWVADRVKTAQDILGMHIGLENASYYFSPPGAEMTEAEFIAEIVKEADCLLHLDINNVYVNSQNFGFDAKQYLLSLPLHRTCYMHVAGHYQEHDGFLIDTHGAPVIDPVWQLLDEALSLIGPKAANLPICLERDFNFPPLTELLTELSVIEEKQAAYRARVKGDER